jgi:hypothetical protein
LARLHADRNEQITLVAPPSHIEVEAPVSTHVPVPPISKLERAVTKSFRVTI